MQYDPVRNVSWCREQCDSSAALMEEQEVHINKVKWCVAAVSLYLCSHFLSKLLRKFLLLLLCSMFSVIHITNMKKNERMKYTYNIIQILTVFLHLSHILQSLGNLHSGHFLSPCG